MSVTSKTERRACLALWLCIYFYPNLVFLSPSKNAQLVCASGQLKLHRITAWALIHDAISLWDQHNNR